MTGKEWGQFAIAAGALLIVGYILVVVIESLFHFVVNNWLVIIVALVALIALGYWALQPSAGRN